MNILTYEELVNLVNNQYVSEYINLELFKDKLDNGENISFFIGLQITGNIHIGHLLPIGFLSELSKYSNVSIKFFLSTVHAELDSKVVPNDSLRKNILVLLKLFDSVISSVKIYMLNIPVVQEIIKNITTNNKYMIELFTFNQKFINSLVNISTKSTVKRVLRTVHMENKQNSTDKLLFCNLLYGVFQTADVEFFNYDVAICATDQRKIYTLTQQYCKKIKRNFGVIYFKLLTINNIKISKSRHNCPSESFTFSKENNYILKLGIDELKMWEYIPSTFPTLYNILCNPLGIDKDIKDISKFIISYRQLKSSL